jgi:hypothetical protein
VCEVETGFAAATRGVSLACKKVGRPIRGLNRSGLTLSAHVGDALLSIFLGRGHWPRRQLQHRCHLTLAQEGQQHGPPVWEFERIVVRGRLVLARQLLFMQADVLTGRSMN